MYIGGHNVTAPLIARFLHKLKVPAIKIASLLEPKDAMNVPCAVELVKALETISTMSLKGLTATERQHVRAITVYSELYGSFVKAFTDFDSSLTDQMTLLSKYAHLAAYCYRKDKAKFMPNPLYFDSVCCVKNAFFCLGKQQLLDDDQAFFLFQLGTDSIEEIFAAARMSAAHNPNFTYEELKRLIESGMDLTRIFAEHPELYSGHRRRSTERGEHVDHLRPRFWKGNARAGSCIISTAWLRGSQEARSVIRRFFDEEVVWEDFFDKPGCDILRPCSKYVGLKVTATTRATNEASADIEESTDDRSMQEDEGTSNVSHVLSELPSEVREAALAAREKLVSMPEAIDIDSPEALTAEFVNDVCKDVARDDPDTVFDIDDLVLQEDSPSLSTTETISVDVYAKKRRDSLWVRGKWVPFRSCIRIIFNSTPRPTQSKDRLVRVRPQEAPSIAPCIKSIGLPGQLFSGDCVATLLHCGQQAYLAILRVACLFQAGTEVYAITHSELPLVQSRIEIRGQVLAFVWDGTQWHWNDRIACLRPPGATPAAQDLLTITVPGVTTKDLFLPQDDSPDPVGSPWTMSHAELSSLQNDLWTRIKPAFIPKLAVCDPSAQYPYRANSEYLMISFHSQFVYRTLDVMFFNVTDYRPPADESARECTQCTALVLGKERIHHIALHLLCRQRGLREQLPAGGIPVSVNFPHFRFSL
jgi:hypothetical protein